jgi:hypothetical protein
LARRAPLIEVAVEPVAVSALLAPAGVLYSLGEGVEKLEGQSTYGVLVALGALALEEEGPRSGADAAEARRRAVTRAAGVHGSVSA